jgi:phosphoglycerate dehydrogenase-like enzyme
VVLVMGAEPADPPPRLDRAADLADLRYAPDADTFVERIGDAEILFAWRPDRDELADAWAKAGRLRWIQSRSAGVDGLLFPELVESEVTVTNARGVFEEPIAEWVIGAMLAFATGLHRSIVDQGRRVWGEDRATERLAGARLVVVGPGPIGRATATRALALGMSVELVGRTGRTDATFGEILPVDRLSAALAEADYVLDALPLTAQTRHLFDGRAFAAMRSTARFLNVGRGSTVDERALVDALGSGRIAGAALDVFEEEPLPAENALWGLPNVIVSPHVCGDVEGWEGAVVDVFVDNLGRWVKGEPLRNLIDKRLGHGVD